MPQRRYKKPNLASTVTMNTPQVYPVEDNNPLSVENSFLGLVFNCIYLNKS